MSVQWTIKSDGVEKTLAEWKLSGVKLRFVNQSPDQLTFIRRGQVDDDLVFAYEGLIHLYREEGGVKVPWFTGIVTEADRDATPGSEFVSYKVEGPWWYLNNLVFRQTWKVWNGSAFVDDSSSHVILGQTPLGERQGVKAQILEAVNWCMASGAPFQVNPAFMPDANVPFDEGRDMTCGEVLKKMLRWLPDSVAWFDYTTVVDGTPVPTLNIRRRPDLTVRTINIAGRPTGTVKMTPLYAQLRPAVVLKFEQSVDQDGTVYQLMSEQKYPGGTTGLEFKALVLTVNLQGFTASHAYADVVTETINTADLNWWKARLPELNDASLASVTLVGGSVVRETSLPRELIDGQIAPWMAVNSVHETITATVETQKIDDGTRETKMISYRLVSTNAVTSRYSSLQSYTGGDTIPLNLAQRVHEAVGTLQYRGNYSFKEEEVSAPVGVGCVVNMAGGRAEWASMNAVVWTATQDIDSGGTEIEMGPTETLGPQDLVALLNVNRSRFNYTAPAVRTSGIGGSTSLVELGRRTPRENSGNGSPNFMRLVVSKTDFGKTDINAEDLPTWAIGKWRLAQVCDEAGVNGQCYVMMTQKVPV
jgi:hypothetical protein